MSHKLATLQPFPHPAVNGKNGPSDNWGSAVDCEVRRVPPPCPQRAFFPKQRWLGAWFLRAYDCFSNGLSKQQRLALPSKDFKVGFQRGCHVSSFILPVFSHVSESYMKQMLMHMNLHLVITYCAHGFLFSSSRVISSFRWKEQHICSRTSLFEYSMKHMPTMQHSLS